MKGGEPYHPKRQLYLVIQLGITRGRQRWSHGRMLLLERRGLRKCVIWGVERTGEMRMRIQPMTQWQIQEPIHISRCRLQEIIPIGDRVMRVSGLQDLKQIEGGEVENDPENPKNQGNQGNQGNPENPRNQEKQENKRIFIYQITSK